MESNGTRYTAHRESGQIAGLYDLEETLGRGHFAVVKSARHVFTGEKVAVKVIDKTKLDSISKSHLLQEVRCMKLVQHPNVVRLYEVIDTYSKLYLILELADGGDLYDYIMKHESGLSESVAQVYFAQIVRAISYCHHLHVVHRDLKPENVVFFEKFGIVKLTDFGFSNKFCPGQKLETSCGSLAYSAPEILLGDSYDAPAVDIWSLGVILYMLVCGRAPFQEASDTETLTMIMDCKYPLPNHVSNCCRNLICRMLVKTPEKRATLEEITSHPWLRDTEVNDSLPLISQLDISDENHALIIQKMVNGGIASMEEILDAVEQNAYNHITATYYLLVERKLRCERKNSVGPIVSVDKCPAIENSASSNVPAQVNYKLNVLPRARKCSIVAEEEDEEDEEEAEEIRATLSRKFSRSEGKLKLSAQELRKLSIVSKAALESENGSPQATIETMPSQATLVSARSSPQLNSNKLTNKVLSNPSLPIVSRPFLIVDHRRSKFRSSRNTSCSSSEASDEDSEARIRSSSRSLHSRINLTRRNSDGGDSSVDSSNSGDAEKPQNGTLNGCKRIGGFQLKRLKVEVESHSLNRIAEVQESETGSRECVRNDLATKTENGGKIRATESIPKRLNIFEKCANLHRRIFPPSWWKNRNSKSESRSPVRNTRDVNQNKKK